MNYYSSDKQGRSFAVGLARGDDLLECVNTLIEQEHIQDGVVLVGNATFYECVLHFMEEVDDPSKVYNKRWEGESLEVVAIQGVIADGKPHLHAVISTADGAFAGHVEPGCKIGYLGELFILETPGLSLTRVPKDPDPNGREHRVKILSQK